MPEAPPPAASRRRAAADAGALTAGTVVAGVLAYAFVIVGTRDLGAEAFAPVSVLWTLWSITAAVVTFPVQHWLIRTLSLPGGEEVLAHVRDRLVLVAVAAALLVATLAWSAGERLFGVDGLLFPIMAGLIPLGSMAMGLSRGVLAGRGRFGSVGLAIASENGPRVLVAALLAVTGSGTPGRYGLGLVAGFAVAALWPSALRARRDTPPRRPALGQVRLLAEIVGGSALAQVVLAGAPLLVALLGGADVAITSVFAALALFRAPYIVAAGLAARATGSITLLHEAGDEPALRRLRRLVVLGVVVLVGPVAGLAAVVGQPLLRAVFGPGVVLSGTAHAMVAAGTVLALGGLAMTILLIGRGRGSAVTTAWVIALASGLATIVAPVGQSAVTHALLGFLVAEGVALLGMVVQDVRRPTTRAAPARAATPDAR